MANTSAALKIAGFGSRIMGGHRHAPGILPLACSLIEERLLVGVQLTNIGLRQPNEDLQESLLRSNVDYLVLESTPVDVRHSVDIKDISTVPSMRFRSNASCYFDLLADLWGRLKNEFFLIIEHLSEIDPMTPILEYLAAIALVASACRSTNVTAVVLLPFTCDFCYSARSMAAYRAALQDIAKVQDILLVDCVNALKARPGSSMLKHDHRYLSPNGQQSAGQAIADTIVTNVLTRSRRFERSILSTKADNNQFAFHSRGI